MSVLFKFQSVDEKATAANVRQFFKQDVDELEQLAGDSLSGLYHSPSFDSTPAHTNHLNNTETQVIKVIDARKELGLIVQTMKECTGINETILVNKYIKHLPMFKIEQAIGYSSTQTKTKQRDALIEFAYRYVRHGRDLRIMKG